MAQALEGSYDRKREALKVESAGMEMGFDTGYSLGRVLFQDGNALQHRWL